MKYRAPEEIPSFPETPLVPDVPEVPLVPEVPEVPEVPLVPDVPDVPLVPDVPDVPEVATTWFKDVTIDEYAVADSVNSEIVGLAEFPWSKQLARILTAIRSVWLIEKPGQI